MAYVAVAVGFAALGTYLGRDLRGGTGLVLFISAFACILRLNIAAAKGREQLAIGLMFGLGPVALSADEAGRLRGSFVPPKPQRRLRTLTRYRKTQIAERQREANRLHKALEDTGIKLDCVATNILGLSGRAMLDAPVAGTTHPDVLAELAKGRLRAKLPALPEAVEGRVQAHHALVIGAMLAHLDFLDEQIHRLTAAIEAELGPTGLAGVALAATITGVGARTAEVMIAEIGADMTVLPTARHLASWAGRCPGNDQSAGKRRSGRTRNGSQWLAKALEEAAMAAIRSRDSYPQAKYNASSPGSGTAARSAPSSTRC
jgi:transposase